MEPAPLMFETFRAIGWFSQCGNEPSDALPSSVLRVQSVEDAIRSAHSNLWMDVGTHAQGDLTGYLARTNYDVYGTTWNPLSNAIGKRIKGEIMPDVNNALARIAAEALSKQIELDLNRIALQSAYAKRFRRVPDFFQQLFVIYERGHLPCGWSGDLQTWPEGEFIIF